MKTRFGMILVLLLAASSAMAQIEMTVYGTRLDVTGENRYKGGVDLKFDDGSGFGAGINYFVTRRFSAELAVFGVRSEGVMRLGEITIADLGSLDLLPISLLAQFHLSPKGRFDPYIGAGVAYVMSDDLASDDLDALEAGTVELEDLASLAINGGLVVRFTDNFGVLLDARYFDYKPTSFSTGDDTQVDLEIKPLLLSVGVQFRF